MQTTNVVQINMLLNFFNCPYKGHQLHIPLRVLQQLMDPPWKHLYTLLISNLESEFAF